MASVAAAVAAAWTRWRRFHDLHNGDKALGVAELEAQFELVATGLAVDEQQLEALCLESAKTFVELLTPLPEQEEMERFHFTIVVAAILLEQILDREKELAESLLMGSLMTEVLLPVLRFERYASLHHAALGIVQTLLQCEGKQETVTTLFSRVGDVLLDEQSRDETVSYTSLCCLLELLLHQNKEDEDLVEVSMKICSRAAGGWRHHPQFLRAVSVHVVPVLLEKDAAVDMPRKVLQIVVNACSPIENLSNTAAFPQELLYLVCIIMPKAPRDLIADSTLQQLVCFALRHSDPLLRKQGLHILKVAFSHCVLLVEPIQETSKHINGIKAKKNGLKPRLEWVETWQSFITASEVIQMHHEQHLIEQVWPQVADLLTRHLMASTATQDGSLGQWPVQLSFGWMESLLVRLFAHDNPVVKRLFLSNFMEACVQSWQQWGKQHGAIDRSRSFACAPTFHRFVLVHVLRVCNDPVLYKHTHRARFQALLANFLASFLGFQLENSEGNTLDDFVFAIEESIFGDCAENHSPEALLSMLQVFQSSLLVRAASCASKEKLLSGAAVDRLRFFLDVHAMQSFSQAMRAKMLRALSHALTGGFVSAHTLSLSLLARVLNVFPISSLMSNNGETLLRLVLWLNTAGTGESKFLQSLRSALRVYLTSGSSSADDTLSSVQLARLLIFTAGKINENVEPCVDREVDEPAGTPKLLLRAPFEALTLDIPRDEVNDSRLILLVAKLEEQVQKIGASCLPSSRSSFPFEFQRKTFYGEGDKQLSCENIFTAAMDVVRRWLDGISTASNSDEHRRDDAMELVTSAVFVLSQMSTYVMNESGKLREMNALDVVCEDFKTVVATASDRSIFDLALAAKSLAIVAANTTAIDSLRAFESLRMVPLLLELDTSKRYSGRSDARYAISLAASKWVLLRHVVEASSFIDTKLLRATHGACVSALPTAGMDPLALIHMVEVLSLTLAQLTGLISAGSDDSDDLLEEIWSAYSDSKAKPDALTRAVVTCMFQPAFVLNTKSTASLKHWIGEFVRFGSRHRPNVIFHLACRLCQIWRAHPTSALHFVDELVELLLYKEPLIDEKEQLTTEAGAPFQGFEGFTPAAGEAQTPAITGQAKDKFVRLVVLSFLDDVAVDSTATSSTQQLMDALLSRLLELNASPDWQKQHMLNSDGFGKKLRSWQTLCIISAHITQPKLESLLPTLRTAFAVPQLPSVRYYMELFGMRLATKFPREVCKGLLLPMLRDANLMPQVGASLLLVSAYLANHSLDNNKLDLDYNELLETMLPWLNTSHGYTRVLAQFLLAKVLPRHIHQLRLASTAEVPSLRFLEGTARYLSENKECKRMLRRQARQLEEFHPDYESSLLGMLSSGFISEFGELLPRDEALRFSEQLKTAMNELYLQYQLENFPPPAPKQSLDTPHVVASQAASGVLTVQRKIDTTALLLEDSALPVAMRADFDAARRGDTLNARSCPRQPIIMCATLVDKVPNLAGLARTCEIFNAQKLIVPNLRVAEQDATFATVSATAHKWMPLEEVRPHGNDLREALLRWKREGYTIVAVEQTASSVSLANHTLPRKMVVVLGREKEGIPVDVLQLVDLCVEIPQFGLVRSLNVHVSGALLLWEYTQQQLQSGALESTL